MAREPAIHGDASIRKPRRAWLVWSLSIVVLLAISGLAAWKVRAGKSAVQLFETRGLKLVEREVHLPASSFKLIDFSLPCAGTLTLDLTCAEGNSIEVFVVPPGEIARMQAKQTFSHLDGFDGQLSEKYQRSGDASPGKHCLVLMDKSGRPVNSSRTSIQILARLTDLK
jgi:hypothetical protein